MTVILDYQLQKATWASQGILCLLLYFQYQQLGLALLAFFIFQYLNDRQEFLADTAPPRTTESAQESRDSETKRIGSDIPPEMRRKLESAKASKAMEGMTADSIAPRMKRRAEKVSEEKGSPNEGMVTNNPKEGRPQRYAEESKTADFSHKVRQTHEGVEEVNKKGQEANPELESILSVASEVLSPEQKAKHEQKREQQRLAKLTKEEREEYLRRRATIQERSTPKDEAKARDLKTEERERSGNRDHSRWESTSQDILQALSPEQRAKYEKMMEQKRLAKMSDEQRAEYYQRKKNQRPSLSLDVDPSRSPRSGKNPDTASPEDREKEKRAMERETLATLPPEQRAKYETMLEQKRVAQMSEEEKEAYMQKRMQRRKEEKEKSRRRALEKMGLGSSGLSPEEKAALAR